MQNLQAESVWVDGTGHTLPVGGMSGVPSRGDCLDAFDRRGWINVRSTPQLVELWVNPLTAQQETVRSAVEILRVSAGDRPLVIRVHDREARGSLVAETVEKLPDLIREAVGLTSRPGHPLMQDRLVGCLPTDINDVHVREMWRFLVESRFAQTDELVDRIVQTEGRAKLVSVHGQRGTVRYLAHDRQSAALWAQPQGMVGRLLDDLPIPAPLKRSLRADLAHMVQERQIVVSFVRGLRRVMGDDAPTDSFFRICIPLPRIAGSPDRTALVLLSPYG